MGYLLCDDNAAFFTGVDGRFGFVFILLTSTVRVKFYFQRDSFNFVLKSLAMSQLILFDTEYTAWEGSQERRWSEPWEHREIIQIAAVKVALEQGYVETACFDRLVRPRLNPLLSAYITGLTGITQQEIDARGVSFDDAYRDFYSFCEQGRLPLFSWGDDPSVLRENCTLADLPFGDYPSGLYDIRDALEAAGLDTRLYSSGTVHQSLGLEFPHASHNALNDVRSLAITLSELARQGRIDGKLRDAHRYV